MTRLLFSAALGLLLAMPASAAIYRYTDEHGNTVFTSRPPQDKSSEEVKLQSPNLIQPPPQLQPAAAEQKKAEEGLAYESIEITGVPEVVRSATLRVQVSLQPALHDGHRLSLKYDGQPVGEPGTSTSFRVADIERGVHRLQAVVEGDDGVVASSEVVEFQALRTSLLGPGRSDGDSGDGDSDSEGSSDGDESGPNTSKPADGLPRLPQRPTPITNPRSN